MTRDQRPLPVEGASQRGWQIVEGAAWAAVVIQVISVMVSAVTSDASMRVLALVTGAGMLVLRGIILVGVRERGRWSLWSGGLLSLIFFFAPLILVHAHVEISGGSTGEPVRVIEVPPAQAILGWATVAASVAYVAGVVMVLVADRKRR